METTRKLSKESIGMLQCPVCHGALEETQGQFRCLGSACGSGFPIVKEVPVLINESNSVFSIADFVQGAETYALYAATKNWKTVVAGMLPGISRNVKAKQNYQKLGQLLASGSGRSRVLVIGGGIVGAGMDEFVSNPQIELVESDVSIGPRTAIILDAHDIPFKNETFDCVIVQAVLEHVVDPYRCVEEIHRVLKKDGLVYAETPFMQQVHGGRYDFTRFTHLGHRRLFRKFDEIESGAVCGPGMALAWSYEYFLLSFTQSKFLRNLILVFSRCTSFFLKYFDRMLIDKPGALDAASGVYFIGRKSNRTLPDRELLKLFKGYH